MVQIAPGGVDIDSGGVQDSCRLAAETERFPLRSAGEAYLSDCSSAYGISLLNKHSCYFLLFVIISDI